MDNINLQTAEALQNKRRGGRPRGSKLTDRLSIAVTAAQKQRIEQFCSDNDLGIKELVFKAINLYIPGFYSDHLASLSSNVDRDLGTIELYPQPLTEWGDREDHSEATIAMDARGRDRLIAALIEGRHAIEVYGESGGGYTLNFRVINQEN